MKVLTSTPIRWDHQTSAAQCMTSAMFAVEPVPLPTPEGDIHKIRDSFAEPEVAQLFSVHITDQAQWNFYAACVARQLFITTSKTCHSALESGCDRTRRFERPTPQDWKRWRPKIVQQYQQESAPQIVDRLRCQGYNVTVKMLRDRLKAWGANTKTKRFRPFPMDSPKALNTPAESIQQHQLLLSLNHWHDLWWERRKAGGQNASPDINVLYDFCDVARVAVRRDSPSTWRYLRRQADKVASVDWSKLTPLGLLRLASRDACFAPGEKILSDLEGPWINIITKGMPRGHPILQLVRRRCHADADIWIWHALLAMHESKVRLYDETERCETTIARARVNIAAILIQLCQHVQADRVLHPCTTSAEVEASASARDQVYYMLGQSSQLQGHYEAAAQYFWRVKRYACGGMPSRINIANQLAKCLLWSGEAVKAQQVLQELFNDLQSCDLEDTCYEADRLWLSNCLENMVEDLAPLPEFEVMVDGFRRLKIISFDQDSTEPTDEAAEYRDTEFMEALTLESCLSRSGSQLRAPNVYHTTAWPATIPVQDGLGHYVSLYNVQTTL